ncbi:unnamed protein product [Lathyrus oleraceus]
MRGFKDNPVSEAVRIFLAFAGDNDLDRRNPLSRWIDYSHAQELMSESKKLMRPLKANHKKPMNERRS